MLNIVIVGASSGLGLELAKLFKDHKLFLLSRNIKKTKLPDKKITCDLQSLTSIKKAISQIKAPVDVFINCSGISLEKSLDKCTDEQVQKTLNTNLVGAIFISKYIYQKMLENKKGFIVNISSTSGKKARDKETVYCATKFGLAGFTESLRLEAREHNIRVATIYPGGMKTNFWKNNPKDISSYMNPKYVAKQIFNLVKSNPSVCPSELVIERF